MDKQVALGFPTPIGRFAVPGPAAVNRELRRVVLERERSEATQIYSNAGGWHSKADLLEWPYPEIKVLRGWIFEAVQHMVNTTLELMKGSQVRTESSGSLQVKAWANVCRAGHYHRIHNHPGSAWSGVYYVTAGTDAPDRPLSGQLELLDPRPFTEMVATPGSPFGQKVLVKAEPGLMILFPGWLYHFVNPYFGEGERISVAFNAIPVQGS
jgi:uncharacterized protein (TIGR02466 family)